MVPWMFWPRQTTPTGLVPLSSGLPLPLWLALLAGHLRLVLACTGASRLAGGDHCVGDETLRVDQTAFPLQYFLSASVHLFLELFLYLLPLWLFLCLLAIHNIPKCCKTLWLLLRRRLFRHIFFLHRQVESLSKGVLIIVTPPFVSTQIWIPHILLFHRRLYRRVCWDRNCRFDENIKSFRLD